MLQNTVFPLNITVFPYFYRPRMREGDVFILSVCLSVPAIAFECLDIETSFLVWW